MSKKFLNSLDAIVFRWFFRIVKSASIFIGGFAICSYIMQYVNDHADLTNTEILLFGVGAFVVILGTIVFGCEQLGVEFKPRVEEEKEIK